MQNGFISHQESCLCAQPGRDVFLAFRGEQTFGIKRGFGGTIIPGAPGLFHIRGLFDRDPPLPFESHLLKDAASKLNCSDHLEKDVFSHRITMDLYI